MSHMPLGRPAIRSEAGGTWTGRARVRGCDVVADLYLDRVEIDRRRQFEPPRLGGLDLLNLLLRMPLWRPRHRREFSSYEWALLLKSGGAVTFEGHGTVTRHAVPPIDPILITLTGRSWRVALDHASRFAPYSSRRVVLDRLPTDDTELRLEAAYRGIGVAVVEEPGAAGIESDLIEVVACAPFAAERYTGASWKMAEDLFVQTGLLDSAD
jgi:hypothetical protein